jgi:hypothetical protein
MVKLPPLSNEVVQTSSETTSEVHVRSAVEDVHGALLHTCSRAVHSDKIYCSTHPPGTFVVNELACKAPSLRGRK